MRGRSFADEQEARRFGLKVDKYGWSRAVTLHNEGEKTALRKGATQLESIHFVITDSAVGDWHLATDTRAVLKTEISLGLDWSDVEEDENVLASSGPSLIVQPLTVRACVLWNGQPVDTVRLILVGELLSYLPAPYRHEDRWAVTPWQHAVARLVDGLSGSESFEDYFKQAEFLVRDRPGNERPWVRIVPVFAPAPLHEPGEGSQQQ